MTESRRCEDCKYNLLWFNENYCLLFGETSDNDVLILLPSTSVRENSDWCGPEAKYFREK